MRTFAVVLAALAALSLSPRVGRADLTIQMKDNEAVRQTCLTEHKLVLQAGDMAMIFRGDKGLLWAINPKEKTYMEMTEQDMKAMREKIQQATAQMAEMMKNVPPEQRAKMAEMMKSAIPAQAKGDRTVKPLGGSKTINGFSCTSYMVSAPDGSSTEVWASEVKSLGLTAADMGVFKEFSDFVASGLPGMDKMQDLVKDYANPGKDQVPGFPVLTIQRDAGGKELWRSELVKLSKDPIPAAKFELPAGLKKEATPSHM